MKFLAVSVGFAALASAVPTPTVVENVAQLEKRASLSDVMHLVCDIIEQNLTSLYRLALVTLPKTVAPQVELEEPPPLSLHTPNSRLLLLVMRRKL